MTFIIAEAGVNHDGDLSRAIELVSIAAESKANAVKFQYFNPESIVHPSAKRAQYQTQHDQSNNQESLLKNLQLNKKDFETLKINCEKQNIEFMATPFDLNALQHLLDISIERIKIASGDIIFFPLLLKAAQSQKPIILSTGMANLAEIEQALAVIAYGALEKGYPKSMEHCYQVYWKPEAHSWLQNKVTLMQCTSEYPTPPNAYNLKTLITFKHAFGLDLGLSDHTLSIGVACAATALGAKVFEKHFTDTRVGKSTSLSPDHQASLEPHELSQYVQEVNAASLALGHSRKQPTDTEQAHRFQVRRGLYASGTLPADQAWVPENIDWLRPSYGESNEGYWSLLGQKRSRAYENKDGIFKKR
jgi:sialic acid synthase SpsE